MTSPHIMPIPYFIALQIRWDRFKYEIIDFAYNYQLSSDFNGRHAIHNRILDTFEFLPRYGFYATFYGDLGIVRPRRYLLDNVKAIIQN